MWEQLYHFTERCARGLSDDWGNTRPVQNLVLVMTFTQSVFLFSFEVTADNLRIEH